jgi:hypothetical protein
LLPAAVRKRLHGRAGGYGRAFKRSSNKKLGTLGARLGALIHHEYYPRGVGGPTWRFVFIRDRSKVHGVGLFAGMRIVEGETLGFFTGTRLTTKEALAAHTKRAKSSLTKYTHTYTHKCRYTPIAVHDKRQCGYSLIGSSLLR